MSRRTDMQQVSILLRWVRQELGEIELARMKEHKEQSLLERRGNATRAKAALQERVRALPGASDPTIIAKKAARQEVAAARVKRVETRKQEETARLEKLEAERIEQVALQEQKDKQTADSEVARMSEAKAQRDARYAARKQRKA